MEEEVILEEVAKTEFNDDFYFYGEPNALIPGDPHLPTSHPDMLPYCEALKDKHKTTALWLPGDVFDNPNMSTYTRHPDAMPQCEMLTASMIAAYEWDYAFSKKNDEQIRMIIGNHEARLFHRLQETCVGYGVMNTKELMVNFLGMPPSWECHTTIIIPNDIPNGDIVIMHGDQKGISGTNPMSTLRSTSYSVIHGHSHTLAGVLSVKDKLRKRFVANVGCGSDDNSYAFEYNKMNIKRDIVAVGILQGSEIAVHCMPMDKYNRWTGKLR